MTKEKKSSSEPKQIVAGYVPESLATRFSLYTTLHNIPRAAIIEMIVAKILEDAPDNDAMVTGLMVDAVAQFKARNERTGMTWRKWAKTHREFLVKRKLPKQIIDEILSRSERAAKEMEKESDGTNQ